jgi:superfamily II DNA/RNA helicase
MKFFADINKFIKKAAPVTNQDSYTPTHSFDDLGLIGPVKENIITRGYTAPTAIQDQAIKPILEGKDVIGLANTGTGKTAAFLIPIINTIFTSRDKKALIIAPTRELAIQINTEFRNFAQGLRVYSTIVTGGANMHRQISEIRRNPHVVIATPGRLKDLVQQNVLHLEDFSIFVLDEVDLMVDIGFIEDIKFFISYLPKVRQSLFFSATISPKISDVLRRFVNDPITVSVKMQDTSDNVEQNVVKVISRDKKVDQLHDLLISDGFDKVLIFGRTKHGVEDLYKQLEGRGFKVGALHGNKNQGARRRVLESFKRDEISILLATDVASRGLDIDDVTHVINYELPESYEDYIHRIGRTGRANKQGTALTFID